jgi:hypothetical protein
MGRKDEEMLWESLDRVIQETHENNVMLQQICQVINVHLARHHQENEDDFGRNVLANLVSGMVDIRRIKRK